MIASHALQLSAYAHRPWYLPGDTVRVQVYLECVRGTDSTRKSVFVAAPAEPMHNHFNAESTAAPAAREAELVVHELRASAAAHCQRNPSALQYRWAPGVPVEVPMNVDTADKRDGVSAQTSERRELFSTPWWTVAEAVFLRTRMPVAHTFSFRLPTNLPPSYSLMETAAWTDVRLSAQWSLLKSCDGADAAERSQTTLGLPLRIYNPATAISHFFFAAAFPLDARSTLVKNDYEFAAIALPPVPSSAVSAPLDSGLYPNESQLKGCASLFHEACVTRQNELTEFREPTCVAVPVGSVQRALEVRLLSTIVPLGGAVQGVLLDGLAHVSPSTDEGEDGGGASPVLVRASGALEMLDCCPLLAVGEGVPAQVVHGVDGVALLRTFTVTLQEWTLLDSPTTPFVFPLPPELTQPTTLTDMGIVLWQLRIKVQWTTRSSLARSREKGADVLTMCTTGPELVLPVTIVPPVVPARPRRGPLLSTFSS